MNRKIIIHDHLRQCAYELLAYIKEAESGYEDRWVPASKVKEELALNFVAVPKGGTQYGEKGWLFAILAHMLEDMELLEYQRNGSRSFCRSRMGATSKVAVGSNAGLR